MKQEKILNLSKILLTIGALEFFGPIARDTNSSHLLNDAWVGHARFHLMWNICLWASMGIYSIYILWGKKEVRIKDLYTCFSLQVMNAIGFWGSVLLSGIYQGDIFDASIHVGIMNVNENILVFSLLSSLLLINYIILKKGIEPSFKEVNV
ncbi:MAG TPA: hypothetical protein PK079_11645 [Leptospiraceae bacterium]|nr:hypothetical protein [Leptospiraceae bacterium]HMW07601.1 hypothetical protein [Leptospiraceae bacterium]HMX33021.1 hypothetical protein [Leptospiraceae bacterium]HMY33184.1 hypothetical protein [Leptospiraceae bacterium]HMZ66359.1 hypothetical protein [Leptospiraceae bacterium]